ncbi:MAG: replication-associated recombination protein A [Acidaminococcaceae bacterium]
MDSLFATIQTKPLADRMRPKQLQDFIGQAKVVGQASYLRRMIENDSVPSILFYGPPGTGKTTMAEVIANLTGAAFEAINAVSSGVPELRKLIARASERLRAGLGRTIVFIDEIHRFNKGQQDVLLPHVENGTIILLGATTENPFFEINSPLLSRMKIIRLELLTQADIKLILQRALTDEENGYGREQITLTTSAMNTISSMAAGDARVALNLLEQAKIMLPEGKKTIELEDLQAILGEALLRYDKKGDYHYDVVSAFIKSMRGSDADAALHYLARMLESGEDVRFIARRIVICAAEDIGNADPQALVVANAAAQAAHFIGLPEAGIPLAQAVCYLAKAPKSNSCYLAIAAALSDVKNKHCGSVPAHLKDAHYAGASKLAHGQGYLYPHDYPEGYVKQQYLPDELKNVSYYVPKSIGAEKKFCSLPQEKNKV